MPVHVDDRSFRPAVRAGIDPARMVLVTAPTVEPVSVDGLREYVRADAKLEARTLGIIIKAARSYFEKITGLALVSQEWRAEFDYLPTTPGYGGTCRELVMPRAPLLAITHIKYKAETTGTLTTFASASYTAAGVGNPRSFARVWVNDNADWPDLGSFPAALQVQFTAGYGTEADAVPEEIRLAVLMLAAWWHENRLPVNVGNIVNPLPSHLDSLIEMHRVAFVA